MADWNFNDWFNGATQGPSSVPAQADNAEPTQSGYVPALDLGQYGASTNSASQISNALADYYGSKSAPVISASAGTPDSFYTPDGYGISGGRTPDARTTQDSQDPSMLSKAWEWMQGGQKLDGSGMTNMEKWVIPGATGAMALYTAAQQAKARAAKDAQLQARLDAQYADALARRKASGFDTSLASTVAGLPPIQQLAPDAAAKMAAVDVNYGRKAGMRQPAYFTGSGANIVPKAAAHGGSITSYYASGGAVDGDNDSAPCPHCGGLGTYKHYVNGGTSGQADKIPAMLSDGEYVFDADSVAALGDGNNAAGAKKLDKMRVSIRTHKRAAPATKIPSKAKDPMAYLKGGK